MSVLRWRRGYTQRIQIFVELSAAVRTLEDNDAPITAPPCDAQTVPQPTELAEHHRVELLFREKVMQIYIQDVNIGSVLRRSLCLQRRQRERLAVDGCDQCKALCQLYA